MPRRNLQVLQPSYECGEVIDAARLAAAISAHFAAFDLIEGEGEVALALRWSGAPTYERVSAFAEAIRHGLATTIERKKPVYIMLDGDIAQTLGAILREELLVESEILAIDGVVLRDFDYIDLGRIRMPSYTVPVTIKSLLFSEDPRRGRPPSAFNITMMGMTIIMIMGITMIMITIITSITSMTNALAGRLPVSRPDIAPPIEFKGIVIGLSIAAIAWLALVPLVFLLWQSILTPQTAAAPAQFTLENFRIAYFSTDTARLFLNSVQFAAGAAGLALFVGTGLAWMNERTNTPVQGAVLRADHRSAGHSRHSVHGLMDHAGEPEDRAHQCRLAEAV